MTIYLLTSSDANPCNLYWSLATWNCQSVVKTSLQNFISTQSK